MNHRIGMMFTPGKGWHVTQCYEGNGPVPLVRTYRDGSKELFLSTTTWLPTGVTLSPRDVMLHWQNRPRRQRALTAWKAKHAPFDFQFSGGTLRELAHA